MSNVAKPMRLGPAQCDECGGTFDLVVACSLSRRALGEFNVTVLERAVRLVLEALDWEVSNSGARLVCPPCRDPERKR